MKRLGRSLRIFYIIGRYRLDTLLPPSYRPLILRLLFAPFICFPAAKHKRGEQLRYACEALGPIFVKFGQLLSTRPDLIPADIVRELDHLQDNVTPFSKAAFQQLVEQALGDSVTHIFASFDSEPLASASVAQVHAARLHSGEEVVIKAIRPGIEKIIEQDLQLLEFCARLLQTFNRDGARLKPVAVVDEYRQTIFDELNLQIEAANASQLKRNFSASPLLYVPQVFWHYTRRNVMVMERIYGIPVTHIEALKAQNTDMKKLAERGVEIFFKQVFEHNFFHADMHPGNVFVSREQPQNPSYIAIDMAIVGSLSREDQYYLARNLLAMFRRDYRQVAELHVQCGWVPPNTSIAGFEAAIRTVCEPIFEKPLKEISFGEVLINLFSTARRFNMPIQPQLVLLQKTLLNIEGLGRQLYPELDLWQTAHPYLERWLKNRFHPSTLWRELKRYAPEWMEKFPEIPQLVFDNLHEIKQLTALTPELREAAQALADNRRASVRRKRFSLVAATTFIGAGAMIFLSTATITPTIALASSVLLTIGALALLSR